MIVRLILRLLILMICFAASLQDVSGAVSIRYTWMQQRRYVYLRDIAAYYGMNCYVTQENTFLTSKDRKWRIVFTHKKTLATFKGIKLHLVMPAQVKGIQSFISEEDFTLTLDPLLRANSLQSHGMRLIVLDPGHGGKDFGGNTPQAREKNITLSTARKTAIALRNKGYTVAMTRTADNEVSLKARVDYARKLGASLFVSIHTNIANPSVNGLETFCMTPAGTSSTHGGAKKEREPGNVYDKNNMALAFEIHRGILLRLKSNDRGVKRARFYVLKELSCPAILIETGFLSNPQEGKLLQTNAHQQAVADGITEGVQRYHAAIKRSNPK